MWLVATVLDSTGLETGRIPCNTLREGENIPKKYSWKTLTLLLSNAENCDI